MTGVLLDSPSFISTWQAGGSNEVWATRKLPTVLSMNAIKEVLGGALHCIVIEGVDNNAANVWASGSWSQQPCVIRIEMKPNMPIFRMTVRSSSKALSEAFVASISTLLKTQDA